MLKRALFLVLLVLVSTTQVFGLYIRTEEKIHIPKDMIVADNLFAAGKEVIVDGVVTGDLIAFGSRVYINGEVGGNIVAAGEDVRINGVVKMDLFAAGLKLLLAPEARVGKDAFLAAETADVAGSIYRDLKVGASQLNISGTAQIKGNVDQAAEKTSLAPTAKVLGKVTVHEMPKVQEYKAQAKAAKAKFLSVGKIISMLMIIALAILAIFFVPNQVRLVNTQMVSHFWVSILWGILALVLIPLAVVFLLLTIIGLPLAGLLLVAYFFGIYISVIFASIVIGRLILDKIFGREMSLIWSFALGFLIIKLLGMIPIVGWLVGVIVFFWSFGALVQSRFTYYKEARSAGLL